MILPRLVVSLAEPPLALPAMPINITVFTLLMPCDPIRSLQTLPESNAFRWFCLSTSRANRMVQLCHPAEETRTMSRIQFKLAATEGEFQQIHRLNHQVFAEEIPQHPRTPDGQLIDRFHAANRYFIALHDNHLAGMISVHPGPEFSIAGRLADLAPLQALRAPLEVRLLAIVPQYRGSAILPGLLIEVFRYARLHGYSDLVASGITSRMSMYRKMGFRPIGPAVPSGAASFMPMLLPLDSPSPGLLRHADRCAARLQSESSVSLLPGPVEIGQEVERAFHTPPVSHRGASFVAAYEEARSRLGSLMGGMQTAVLGGSGTLANDAVAANLRACFADEPGLVLSNGEFGERLIRQASLAGLNVRPLRYPWGAAWNFNAIERELQNGPSRNLPTWIWAVHLETSTGVLNDLSRLLVMAAAHGIQVSADCVSSLGAVETAQANPLFLASGVSGKALGSYAGLSFVFSSDEAIDRLEGRELCPSFDLVQSIHHRGPTSTISTPLVTALHCALCQNYAGPAKSQGRFAQQKELGSWIRNQIRACGLSPVAAEQDAASTITSFPLPSPGFTRLCRRVGFRIAHQSEYLLARDWGQIATMGNVNRASLEPLFAALRDHVLTPAAQ
jgi:aspartate aminotransferase-like enzyme/GNAT superfamily N-acetyltransferase